jgi:hypothetical protein
MNPASTALSESQVDSADSCRRLTNRVLAIKQILLDRYRVDGHPAWLIRRAIAAAEAEAWLSGFPDLFLPALADEILRQLRQKEALIHPEFAQAA